jgi:diguanylate cyclase (GGDEF)-like protein
MIELWHNLLTNGGKFSKEYPEHRRVYLLNFILLMMFMVCLFFFIVDEFAFGLHVLAFLNLAGSIFSMVVFLSFRKSCDIDKSAMATVLTLFVVLTASLLVIGHSYYALCWLVILPPVAYFLLGRKQARIVVAVYFTGSLAYLLLGSLAFWKEEFPMEALLNIAVSVLGIILLVGYYEISRKEAVNALEQKNKELEILSERDCLTGLYNRNKLNSVISRQISVAKRSGRTFSVLMADVDFFKDINDTYGHMAGDAVLTGISDVLRKTCRETDFVGRWGGEEFLIICPDTGNVGAGILGERIIRGVSRYKLGKIRDISLSIGITSYEEGDTGDTILTRADKALYIAKENGRRRLELI